MAVNFVSDLFGLLMILNKLALHDMQYSIKKKKKKQTEHVYLPSPVGLFLNQHGDLWVCHCDTGL